MTEETHVVHEVVKEVSYWTPFIQGWLIALGTFLAGAVPLFMWWKAREKEKQAEKDAIEEDARRNAPQYIQVSHFEEFGKKNEDAHAEVRKLVSEAIDEFGVTQTAVLKIGEEVNAVKVDVGKLQGQVESMPDVVVGKMLQQIYHINPATNEP